MYNVEEVFDNIVCLGTNCESAFALNYLYGKIESGIFNWTAVYDINKLIDFINNRNILFSSKSKIEDNKMVRCEVTNFRFHTKLKELEIVDNCGKKNEKNIELIKQEVFSRIEYLANKFFLNLSSGDRIIFVLKFFSYNNYDENLSDILNRLAKTLSDKCKNKNFKIYCVLEADKYVDIADKLLDKRIIIKRLSSFAPLDKAYLFNKVEWRYIFKDLKIKNKKIIPECWIYVKYLRYKILSFILFGKKRIHYERLIKIYDKQFEFVKMQIDS